MSDEVLGTHQEVVDQARTGLADLVRLISRYGPDATCAIGIYARSTRPNTANVKKLEADVQLAARMAEMVFKRLAAAQSWLDDNLIEPYDQRGTQENDIRCMIAADAPVVERWFAGLPTPDVWPPFKKADWLHKAISGLFVRIDFPGHVEPLICFTKWSDSLLLKRRGILAAVSETRYSIQELNGEIYLPETIHFFYFQGCVYALDWKQFENALSFKEMTRERSAQLWTKLLEDLPISGAPNLWQKLSKSVRHQNTIIKTLGRPGMVVPTMQRIQEFITENKLKISIKDGELMVDSSDPVQIEILLTIMANGYVTSDLTDTKLKTLDAEPR